MGATADVAGAVAGLGAAEAALGETCPPDYPNPNTAYGTYCEGRFCHQDSYRAVAKISTTSDAVAPPL